MFGYEGRLQGESEALRGQNNNLLGLVDEMIKYIEQMEETVDEYRGAVRGVREIIKDGDMPDIYVKLMAIRYGRRTT